MIQSAAIQITPEMLRLVAGIDEFKGAWRALGTLAVDADPKLSQVNNLPCCIFVQQREWSDHHGHDWQDPVFAQTEEEV